MNKTKKQASKTCYCPECGKTAKIPLGKRCNSYKCKNCGATLSRDPSGCPQKSSKSHITKPEATEKYIRIPTGTACKVTATITISAKKGIKALYCGKVKKIRTYLFARSKGWTMAKAKAWVKAHKSSLEEKKLIMDAEMSTPQRFKINLPITKTRSRIVKAADGKEKEERYVEGVASSTDVDLQGDRMTEGCLHSMADSLKTHIINLNAEHDTSWRSEIGDLEKLAVNKNKQLVCEAKLNEMSTARDFWYALTEQHKKLGLSVGGYVKDYEMIKEGDGDDAKWVRVFKKIELDHIAVTSRPANPKTWVDAIAKSLDSEKEGNMIKEADIKKVKKLTKSRFEDFDRGALLLILEGVSKSLSDKELAEAIERGLKTMEEIEKKRRAASQTEADGELEEEVRDEEESEEEVEEEAEKQEESEEESEESEEESDEEESEDESEGDAEEESEDDEEDEEEFEDSEEGSEEEEESEDEDEEDDDDEDSEEKSEEDAEEEDKGKSGIKVAVKMDKEFSKTINKISEKLDTVLEDNKELSKKIKDLEKQPAGRKVAIDKTIGGEEEGGTSDPREAMEKKIADLKVKEANNPNLFAMIQRIRNEYKVL